MNTPAPIPPGGRGSRSWVAPLVWLSLTVLTIELGASGAGLPVPSFTFFGEVTDAYGWPFVAADRARVVALRADGRECGRAPVDESMGPGLNYRMEVALTEVRGAAYAAYAVKEGDPVNLVLEMGGARYPVGTPAQTPLLGLPGRQARQDLSLGHDSKHDGLTDEWKDWLIEGSGGLLKSRNDVSPGDDFDGDGVTNLEEYLAGTDPAMADDLPLLEGVRYDPVAGWLAVSVLTVPGRSYQILTSPAAGEGDARWEAQGVSLDPAATPTARFWRGDGQLTWVYLRPAEAGPVFLRLAVQP